MERIEAAVHLASKLELSVAVGHGLHYHNVEPLLRFADIEEMNIGHAIVARAVMSGFSQAVRDMHALLVRT